MIKNISFVYFFVCAFALTPIMALGTTSSLTPQYAGFFDSFSGAGLIDTIKKLNNFSDKTEETGDALKSIPLGRESLENTMKEKSPRLDLEGVNKGVEEETGINFIKFFGWLKKVFLAFFWVLKEVFNWIEK